MENCNNRASLWLLAILLAVPLFLFVAFNSLWDYGWRDTTPRGPLPAVSDWPEPIQDFHTALMASGADTSSFSAYLLYGQPGQLLSTVVCRVDVDDVAWNTIVTNLDLQPIQKSDGVAMHSEIVQSSDTSWWPSTDSDSDYFASARLLAGDEADLYQAARNNDSDTAYIHYYFTF